MLYVVRHGKSFTNAGVHRECDAEFGDSNNYLTAEGVMQCFVTGQSLKDNLDGKLDNIVTSGITRAKQSAMNLASVIQIPCHIQEDSEFNEIKWVHGDTFVDFEAQGITVEQLYGDPDFKPQSDSENMRMLFKRVHNAFCDWSETFYGHDSILVVHYFVIRALLALKDKKDSSAMPDYRPKNMSYYKFTDQDIEYIASMQGVIA